MVNKISFFAEPRIILASLLVVFILAVIIISPSTPTGLQTSAPTGLQSSAQKLPEVAMIHKDSFVSQKQFLTNYPTERAIDFGRAYNVYSVYVSEKVGGQNCAARTVTDFKNTAGKNIATVTSENLESQERFEGDIRVGDSGGLPGYLSNDYIALRGLRKIVSYTTDAHEGAEEATAKAGKGEPLRTLKFTPKLGRFLGEFGVIAEHINIRCSFIDELKATIVFKPTPATVSFDTTPPTVGKFALQEWDKKKKNFVAINPSFATSETKYGYLVKSSDESSLTDYKIVINAHDDQTGISDKLIVSAPPRTTLLSRTDLPNCNSNLACVLDIREPASEAGKTKTLRIEVQNGAGLKSAPTLLTYRVLTPDGKTVSPPAEIQVKRKELNADDIVSFEKKSSPYKLDFEKEYTNVKKIVIAATPGFVQSPNCKAAVKIELSDAEGYKTAELITESTAPNQQATSTKEFSSPISVKEAIGFTLEGRIDQTAGCLAKLDSFKVTLYGEGVSIISSEQGTPGGRGEQPSLEKNKPAGKISVTPAQGETPLEVTLKVLEANDPDGRIASYVWDFDDGSEQKEISVPNIVVKHTYTGEGVYRPALILTDDSGLQTLVSGRVEVTAKKGENQPPYADFVIDTTGQPAMSYLFDAGSSADSERPGVPGQIVSYTWDFGDVPKITTTKSRTTHVYKNPGYYIVVLTVTDNGGLKTSKTKQLTVEKTVVPEIKVSLSQSSINIKEELTATATVTGRTDVGSLEITEDNQIKQKCVIQKCVHSCGPGICTYKVSYPSAGTHYFSAYAKDSAGNFLMRTDSPVSVQVNPRSDQTPPKVSLSYSPQKPKFGDKIQVTATATDNVEVKSVEIYVVGSDNAKKANGYIDTCTFETPQKTATCTKEAYKKSGFNQLLFTAIAFDNSENKFTSNTATITLEALPDKTPPVVSISYSPSNPKAADKVTITATVTDDTLVKSIDLYVDGQKVSVKCTVPQSSSGAIGQRSPIFGRSLGTGRLIASGYQTLFSPFLSITGAQILRTRAGTTQQSGTGTNPFPSKSVSCTYTSTYSTGAHSYYTAAADTSGNVVITPSEAPKVFQVV